MFVITAQVCHLSPFVFESWTPLLSHWIWSFYDSVATCLCLLRIVCENVLTVISLMPIRSTTFFTSSGGHGEPAMMPARKNKGKTNQCKSDKKQTKTKMISTCFLTSLYGRQIIFSQIRLVKHVNIHGGCPVDVSASAR